MIPSLRSLVRPWILATLAGTCALGTPALTAQHRGPTYSAELAEIANLREDLRLLQQRVGELAFTVEQLERENRELRARLESAGSGGLASTAALNAAIADLRREYQAAVAQSKRETATEVAGQLKRLAEQTEAAIAAVARGQAARPPIQTTFSDNFPREGVTHTVQRGETLSSIAAKYGASVADIQNANRIADPTRIQVGQSLFIPGPRR
jgi:LysM repeat protein